MQNELMALDHADDLVSDHFEYMVRRQSRRTGMLLSQEEVFGLWRPSA